MRLQRSSPNQTVHFLLRRLLVRRSAQRGFTLIELLVSMLIGALIVSGLLYGVVEIMQTNQRDAARSDTQRDIQAALDYIARDVREATFVYGVSQGKSCLADYADAVDRGTRGECTGLLAFLPDKIARNPRNMPVLAFWKPEPLPLNIRQACQAAAGNVGKAVGEAGYSALLNSTPCVAQRMYTLVVYSLNTEDAVGFSWRGKARITRFQVPHFTESATLGSITPGWAAPIAKDQRPLTWPVGDVENTGRKANLQEPVGAFDRNSIPGDNVVLTDFVDNIPEGYKTDLFAPGSPRVCPNGFEAPSGIDSAGGLSDKFNSGFYTCVRTGTVTSDDNATTETAGAVAAAAQAGQGLNPEVHIVIRGNAAGKGGLPIGSASLPFQMETRVLSRGVYGKLAN